MKKLQINIDDFRTLIENDCVYVDKTKIVYDLISVPTRYYFLSRPRRFGKTLLVSIFKEIFSGSRELFKDCWIAQSDYAWPKHPVLQLSMASINSSTADQFEASLCLKLNAIAKNHAIHLDKTGVSSDHLQRLIEGLGVNGKVVLLIDEYDHPILNNLHKPETASEIRDILKNFYGVIKGLGGELRFVFFTGVTKFSKTSVFSGLNNLKDLSLQTSNTTLLGYTEHEIHQYFGAYLDEVSKKLQMS